MQKAKEYCDARSNQPKLITLFSWNEWVEGGYLLPDIKMVTDTWTLSKKL